MKQSLPEMILNSSSSYWEYPWLHFRSYGKWADFIPNHIDGTSECSEMQMASFLWETQCCIDLTFPLPEPFWTLRHVVCVDVKGWTIHTVTESFFIDKWSNIFCFMTQFSLPLFHFQGEKIRACLSFWHKIVLLYHSQSYCKFIKASRDLIVN